MDVLTKQLSGTHWSLALIIIFSLTAFLHLAEFVFYKRAAPYFSKKNKTWSYALVSAMHAPLACFIWFFACSISLQILIKAFDIDGGATSYFGPAQRVVSILFLLWFGLRLIRFLETGIVQRGRFVGHEFNDATTVNALAQICRILVIIILLLVAMQSLGIPIGALLTFGGIGGLAVSFAAKDTLANFIGGLMIYWDRPFSVGDTVTCHAENITGVVEKIGWRQTRMLSPEKQPIYVPNSIFSSSPIINISRITAWRIQLDVGLRYDDEAQILPVVAAIKKMLSQHKDLNHDLGVFVAFSDFAQSSLNIFVRAFTKTRTWAEFLEVRQAVYLKILEIVHEHDADFAFPTTTISIPGGIDFVQTEEGDHEQQFQ